MASYLWIVRRAIEACLVRVDNPGLSMRRIRQRPEEQAFSRSGITQAREHKIDRGPGGIDGAVEVAPAPIDMNAGLIDTPGPVGWLEMMENGASSSGP